LDGHLKAEDKKFIMGDKFTLADIKTFPWVRRGTRLGIDIAAEFPSIKAWIDRIDARPDVQEGLKNHRLINILQVCDTTECTKGSFFGTLHTLPT